MKIKFTTRYLDSLRSAVKRLEIGDSECRGLSIRCTTKGQKTWSYTCKANGKMRRICLGEFPAVKLEEARRLAMKRREQKLAGQDVRAVQMLEDAAKVATVAAYATANMRFGEVYELYIEGHAKPNKASWRDDVSLLKPVLTKWASRLIRSITTDDAETLLLEIKKRGRATANRTQAVLRKLFGWSEETPRKFVISNPLSGMKKIGGKENAKARVLTGAELSEFWSALDDPETAPALEVSTALKTIVLTAQRPGEVAGMARAELHDIDCEEPFWIIPKERSKNRREHTVPLSLEAASLIRSALKRGESEDGEVNPFVFASRYTTIDRLQRNSLSKAVARIVATRKMTYFSPHDLRRTAVTLAQSARVPLTHVKALLNHRDKSDETTLIYARYDMYAEKRIAVEAIAKVIDGILNPVATAANVATAA